MSRVCHPATIPIVSKSSQQWAHSGRILIFGDGACSGNPGPGGWGTIVVFPDGRVQELGGGNPQTTNNRMELVAAVRGLRAVEGVKVPVSVFLDSTYVIRGITQWVWGWLKRQWRTAEGEEVSHADLWRDLLSLVGDRKKLPGEIGKIQWHYVRGHTGVAGNERCDEIATGFTQRRSVSLYEGPLTGYSVPIFDIPEDTSLPELRSREKGPKPAAYSYVSVVNGVLERHPDWKSCEARVKGRPGAKFKKALTAEHEAEILAEWGF